MALASEYLERDTLAAIVESSFDAIISKDLSGSITTWNFGAERIFGYSADEVVGESIMVLVPEDRRDEERQVLERLWRGERIEHFETKRRTKAGNLLDVSLTISPIRDGSGRIVGASKVVRDITEQKQSEEMLRQREAEIWHFCRLKTMGQMATGVAHEVKQPLSAILTYADGSLDMMSKSAVPVEKLREAFESIASEAKRAGDIIRSLRSFAKGRQPKRSVVDVNAIVQESLKALEWETRRAGTAVVQELQEKLPFFYGDRVQIMQVVVNLLQNAIQAMRSPGSKGNTLTIKSCLHGQFVRVEVADQGCGMSKEARASIFHPFFTTKPDGMGMGLAISRAIILENGGELTCESNKGGGIVMSFTLPITKERA